MPFCTRIFCRDIAPPSLSEALFWLHQHEIPVTFTGGSSQHDLLSSFWEDVELSYDPEEAPLAVRCLRADAGGIVRLGAEVADFVEDLGDLPESPGRAQVLAQLAATRTLIVIEFPAEGASPRGYEAAGQLASLFVERCSGMAQGDGVGFLDEYDDVILALG